MLDVNVGNKYDRVAAAYVKTVIEYLRGTTDYATFELVNTGGVETICFLNSEGTCQKEITVTSTSSPDKISITTVLGKLLLETGGFHLLLENGDHILKES